jgi:N-methylhydantoinase A
MRIAIDTGGTFTDCVFVRKGRLEIVKVPSTPHAPAQAIANALNQMVGALLAAPHSDRATHDRLDLICGTTVGTNALLERRGGRVALVTTAGFEDVLEIGRQARPRLYDFFVERPAPLVPRERRFGLDERVSAEGDVLVQPSRAEVRRIVRQVLRSGASSAAVCFLFSFLRPEHERAIARELRRAGLEVSVSHEILPEQREYERTATTVANAYLVPVMSRYLALIEEHAQSATLDSTLKRAAWGAIALARRRGGTTHVRIMQSSGGIVSARAASREPVRTILSGPAGGVLGAEYVASLSGFRRVISFDMGGTSTDVALLDGALRTSNESIVADLPVAVPMLDIHTVGAGGGSIARFDRVGALRVGPESAGADPGPICYGRGERPTVTDAHVLLGRIPRDGLLGGSFPLDASRARRFLEKQRGRTKSAEAFAQGIIDVANATMEKAIRVISIERGHDPRDYALVAFGGAGALHGCELAASLRMQCVLVPRFPGGLSALGILRADVVRDASHTVRLAVSELRAARKALEPHFTRIERSGVEEMRREGFPREKLRIQRLLDVRYSGQAFELTVPFAGDFAAAFHRAHEQRYGYADPNREIEAVNVRARLIGLTPKPGIHRSRSGGASPRAALVRTSAVHILGRPMQASVYAREKLRAGNCMAGPAIVTEYSATTLIPPGWQARVDEFGSLILTQKGK